ncbi:uncharacterized protein LOC126567254 [Anopheles maculipalpis]|uniref:uncharacterized protein LOC126567254 n=1 Tax=Anopheles maculipalpis TaxID=1496333 RepID=UPI002159324D|nr:uncharacterized protein LOC126567254 [Anopheles maculipalpis]
MKNSGQSGLLPVDNMEKGYQESLSQPCKDHATPGNSSFNGCCRLCLKGNCHLQKLFPGGYTEDVLISKIFECTTVEITFETDPDALICYSCVAKIEEFHRYREQCRSNDVQHKNSLRRADVNQIHSATTSALLPAKYIKKEIDSEGFEISASDFFPIDTEQSSYGAFETSLDAPTTSVADSSGAVVDSTIPNENGALNDSDEDDDNHENLLELMPERTEDRFIISYTNVNDEYDDHNEVVCEMPIKEEPQDLDGGDTVGPWNDYEMGDDGAMDHHNSTSLVPLLEDCSYSSDSEAEMEVERIAYREVYNDTGTLVCIMQDGFLYVQKSNTLWSCRMKDCTAGVIRYTDRKELQSNGIDHIHTREVRNTAMDEEILQLVEHRSRDDESFHYVTNERHGSSLVYKGYKYCMKHIRVDGTTYWKCRSYNGSCSAAVYQSQNNEFTTVGRHTHAKQVPYNATKAVQPSYVTSVSTEGEGSPPKIKLRIARQTDAPTVKEQTLPEETEAKDYKQFSPYRKPLQVFKRGYGHKIVKNSNGRTRLYFDGNLYVRESSRNDESGAVVVLWRCRRNYDMCGVKALQHEDGLVEVLGEHDHSSLKKSLKIPENVTGTTAYEILSTPKGGEKLLLDGYNYVKAYCRSNGMSLWRCMGEGGTFCRAKVIVAKDGLAYIYRNATHSHSKPTNVKNLVSEMVETSPTTRTRGIKTDENVEKKVCSTSAGTEESKAVTPYTTTIRKPVPPVPPVAPSQTMKVTSKTQPARNYRVIKNKKGNKALVHAGYRYCRIRTRQDGSVCWLCKFNKKTCRVALYEHPDGRLEWTNHRRHNHGPTDPIDPPKKQPPPPPRPSPPFTSPLRGKRTAYHIDDDTFVNNEWFFVRNHKNGTTLVHAGYRYHKKGNRVNDTSLWRCAQACHGCRAAIVLHPDETIAKFDDIDHIHAPPVTAIKEMEVIVGDPDESVERDNSTTNNSNDSEPDLSLVHFNGCIEEQDDPEANMRSLLNTMLLDVSDEPVHKSVDKLVIPAERAHLKYVTNRRHTKSLVFKGYRYARSSIGVRVDGSVRWTCQMNKKTCRVSVRVLKDGSVEMNGQKHNHAQLPEDRESDDDNDDANASVWNDGTNPAVESDDNEEEGEEEEEEQESYYFALNRSNGKSLIYQRNRFSREHVRPDGSTVWRCMVRTDCMAKVVLLLSNKCIPYRDAAHNHPPLDVLPKPIHYPEQRGKLIVKGDMLVYKQNRMKKMKSFTDGSALFKCTEVANCTGIVKIRYEETENGSSSPVVIFDTAHSHTSGLTNAGNSDERGLKPTVGKSKRKSPVKMVKYSPSDGGDTGKEYQLFKNDRGQVSLVYKDYRFSLRNLNPKGDSSWKCRSNRLCNAYVIFSKDGHVIPNAEKGEPKVMPHNHPINGEYIGRAVPIQLDELHPPANNLGQFVSNWMGGLYKTVLGWKPRASQKSPMKMTKTVAPHHNNEPKNVINHKNYSYKLQTTKNGREFWRCTMFKARACRAGLFCTNNGTVIQYGNGRQHNHEPAKPLAASIGHQSNTPRKSFLSIGGAKAKAMVDGAYSPLTVVQKSIKRSQSALPFDEQSTDDTVTPSPPSYQIIKKDGIDTLHYERHRYSVSFSKREENTSDKEPKRWRCCLWNSRHQCPVELTISPTDEIHFVTDPTHNHRPPPPEPQESLDRQLVVFSGTKGTKKYELMGRSQKIVFYKGYKFSWKEECNGTAYYRCLCHSSHDCAVTVKIDLNGLLYECSASASHNHSPTLDPSADSVVTLPEKPMTERNIASRQTRLAQCSKTGSSDYRFVRSCLGISMIFEGHRYWLHSKLSCGLIVYRCRYQKQKDCTGSVYMDASTQLLYHRYDAEHNHEPQAEDAVAGLEQDTTNTSLNVSEPNDSSSVHHAEPDLDNSSISSTNCLPSAAIVPKKEVIITNDYSFMKDSLNKNQLLYEQYVFEMVPLQYRKNGDKYYSCLFADCSAAVKLLASGALDISNPIHHAHERPDLTDYRDVGKGSSDFLTLASSTDPGTIPMIRFEGYKYCAAAVAKPSPDDTKLFHCQEKNRATGRCSATLEMLPNGRVIVISDTHHHPKPNETENEDSKETTQSNILVIDGRSYAYLETQPDGTGVWKCIDDRKCMAKVYKKPDGSLVHGTIKHVLRHVMAKLPNQLASSVVTKSSAPVIAASSLSISTNSSSSTLPTSGNLRTKWYKGNRYNFYLTRRDGVQYWRCCKRMGDKCEAGIFCHPSGKIVPSNQWPHSHPPLNPSASHSEPGRPKKATEYSSEVKQLVEDGNKSDAKVTTNHPLRISLDANDAFVWYRGVQYSLRRRRPDGIRIYRCRNKPCIHSLVVTKQGKIISKKTTWHSCESQTSSSSSNEDNKGKELVPWTNSASGPGFDKPEIEDPDDLDDHNDSTDIQPIVKRIRLDGSNTGIVLDSNREQGSDVILHTVDRRANNLDTEPDAEREVEPVEESHGGLVPMGDFMDGNGATSSTWDEPEYIIHEFEGIDANDGDAGLQTENQSMDDDQEEEAFQTLSAVESFGESLTCHDASNL